MDEEQTTRLVNAIDSLKGPPAPRVGWERWLNAPFTVTLLGGLFLTLLSALVTQCTTRVHEIKIERLHQRETFVNTFSTKLYLYFTMTENFRKRQIFMTDWKNEEARDTIRYADGRTFAETRDKFEEERKFWLDHAPESPIAQILSAKVIFNDDAETRNALDSVLDAVIRYDSATDYDSLEKARTDALERLENAANAMAKGFYEK